MDLNKGLTMLCMESKQHAARVFPMLTTHGYSQYHGPCSSHLVEGGRGAVGNAVILHSPTHYLCLPVRITLLPLPPSVSMSIMAYRVGSSASN